MTGIFDKSFDFDFGIVVINKGESEAEAFNLATLGLPTLSIGEGASVEGDFSSLYGAAKTKSLLLTLNADLGDGEENMSLMSENAMIGDSSVRVCSVARKDDEMLAFSFEISENSVTAHLSPIKSGNDGYTPIKGVDYWTNADKEEISADANELISEALAERSRLEIGYASTLEECTDTSKVYVLPDGYIYAYMKTESEGAVYTNLVDTSADGFVEGSRFSSSGAEQAESGTAITNYIPFTSDMLTLTMHLKGIKTSVNGGTGYARLCTYDADKNYLGLIALPTVAPDSFIESDYDGEVATWAPFGSYSSEGSVISHGAFTREDARYFRIGGTLAGAAEDIIITFDEQIDDSESSTVTRYEWKSTGRTFTPADYEDRIITLEESANDQGTRLTESENKINTLEESVTELKNSASEGGIPDYWEEHLAEKINTIKSNLDEGGKDCFGFVVMADTHYQSNLAKLSPLLAKRVMDECGIKYALLLGDVRTRGCHSDKATCETEWENIEKMLAPLKGRILQTQGNHDAGYGIGDYDGDGDEDYYAYEFTPAEMFNRVYRKASLAGDAHYDASGTAFYVDDTPNKVRYVLLNTHLNFDGNEGYESYETVDGMAKYLSMRTFRYTQCQYDFLVNDALSTVPDDDYTVIIASHVPINQSGEMPEFAVMTGVLDAYNTKGSYSGSYAGTSESGYDAVSVNVDFSGAKGRIACYSAGHTHADSSSTACYEGGTLTFPIITTRCDAPEENDSALLAQRASGTITEQSFDVFTVNRKSGVIKITKIGAGDNREIAYV